MAGKYGARYPGQNGRPPAQTTTRTRHIAEQVASDSVKGKYAPLEIMINTARWLYDQGLQAVKEYEGLRETIADKSTSPDDRQQAKIDVVLAEKRAFLYMVEAADTAAKAAPYVHPRLAQVQHNVNAEQPTVIKLVRFGDLVKEKTE